MKTNDESARKVELRTAAARLFRKVGYSRATVRDVAKAVGLQSGSIFYYYKTKEDILVDVMKEGMRQFTETVLAPLREATTPLMRLRALLIGHLKALHGGNDELAVILSEWRSLSPRSRRQIVKQRDEIEAMWDGVLRELATEGRVRGDLSILRLAVLGAANWSLQWYDERGKLSIDELADQLLELFVPAADRKA
ncbi:MAG: TetR/AcrR family transcriptional regulator [Burkholderiaceae bacterium]|nr:TetR/AcrR family transcriptional regulator [Burkholderiaceae bacterium]